MLKAEVKLGAVYIARVSGKLVEVKIIDVLYNQGPKRNLTRWLAKNLSTGREVMIKSAAKLRLKTTSRYTTITPAQQAALACPDNPGTGQTYHCKSLTCPIHGERNQQYAAIAAKPATPPQSAESAYYNHNLR